MLLFFCYKNEQLQPDKDRESKQKKWMNDLDRQAC